MSQDLCRTLDRITDILLIHFGQPALNGGLHASPNSRRDDEDGRSQLGGMPFSIRPVTPAAF